MGERDEQGKGAHKLFLGKETIAPAKLLYGESADLFAKLIIDNAKFKKITLIDIGGYKGELLSNIINLLKEYKIEKIVVDSNSEALQENKVADIKICSNLTKIPLDDKIADIAIMRYVLHWNSLENQKKILSEIRRLTKNFAIVQHLGADYLNEKNYLNQINILFSGKISQLKRDSSCWESNINLEKIFKELKIKFEKVEELRINGLSELFITKFSLKESDSKKVKEILRDYDYLIRSTYLLHF
jgi:hypothetical protein